MDLKDKFALWSFAVLLLHALKEILFILEFGKWENYFLSAFQEGGSILIFLILLIEGLFGFLSIYLLIIYPILLISGRKKK